MIFAESILVNPRKTALRGFAKRIKNSDKMGMRMKFGVVFMNMAPPCVLVAHLTTAGYTICAHGSTNGQRRIVRHDDIFDHFRFGFHGSIVLT